MYPCCKIDTSMTPYEASRNHTLEYHQEGTMDSNKSVSNHQVEKRNSISDGDNYFPRSFETAHTVVKIY